MNKLRLIPYAISAILIGIALYMTAQKLIFKSNAVKTTGLVTGFHQAQTRDKPGEYERVKSTAAPIITYVASDGKEYSFTGEVSSNARFYDLNEKISVLYDPSNPSHAQENGPANFLLCFALGGAGIFLALMVTAFSWLKKKELQRMSKKEKRKLKNSSY